MNLKEQLHNSVKDAMKARDNLRLSAVRMIIAAVKNREIERRSELDDNAVTDVITSLAKQRRESIKLYKEGNRPELAEKEEAELAVLLEFLPTQLTLEEIEAVVTQLIKELDAHGSKDVGRVMKAVTPLTSGKADGKIVNEIVRKLLS